MMLYQLKLNSLKKVISPLLAALTLITTSAQATVVEFETSQGNFKVNLHDEKTPITVANFLNYVTQERYNNTIIHRSVNDFVIQGGGAHFDGDWPLKWITTDTAITNEPVYSNVVATIAMAKSRGNLHSATSQWFINLKDHAASLDAIDIYGGGAYTVFGEVVVSDNEDGMAIVNAIAAINQCDTGQAGFSEVPMPNYSTEQCTDTNNVPGVENFVTIHSVTIVDASVNTAQNLNAIENTRYQVVTDNDEPEKKSGGGSFNYLLLLFVALLPLRLRKL